MTAQLDLSIGEQLRDEGMGKVAAVTSAETVAAIECAIESYVGVEFTADMVRDRLDFRARMEVSERPNILGSVFRCFAKRGLIAPTKNFVHSQRDGARHRRLTCWRLVAR